MHFCLYVADFLSYNGARDIFYEKKVFPLFGFLRKSITFATAKSEKMFCGSLNVCCGNSSVGRAQPCQGWGREFESRFPLNAEAQVAEW